MAVHDLSVAFNIDLSGDINLDSPLLLGATFPISLSQTLTPNVDWSFEVSFQLLIQVAIEAGRSRKMTALSQQLDADSIVSLYTVDATDIGGEIYRFCSFVEHESAVQWQGETYQPLPIETSGWEWSGKGPLPQPIIRLANVNRVVGALAITFNDLQGAFVTRARTFGRFLDNGSDPDPDAYWPLDVYVVDQKTAQNKEFVEWQLASLIDQEGVFLPSRQILKNACRLRYRRWRGAAFDYSKVTCPYVGTDYFKATGDQTANPAEDQCGKKFSDCKKRFGTSPLPFGGFPGVSQYRIG